MDADQIVGLTAFVLCVCWLAQHVWRLWQAESEALLRRAFDCAGVEFDDPLTHDELTGVVDLWQAPLSPMPAPDAPQADFDRWVADALRVVRDERHEAFARTAEEIRDLPEVQPW